jgi:hypothetical protein
MATDVKIRFRSFLPGGGFNSAGAAKQGKTRVVGVVSVTSYTAGGEPLAPVDVGLSVIDSITLRPQDEVASDGAQFRRVALYNQTNDLFYLATIQEDGVVDEYALAATETVEFVAEGDSAHDVELT